MTPQEKRISLHLCRIESKARRDFLSRLKERALHFFSSPYMKRDSEAFLKLTKKLNKLGNPADA